MVARHIVILTAHIPDKDPRVIWFYDSLSKMHNVSFIATDPFDHCVPSKKRYKLFFKTLASNNKKKFSIYQVPKPIRLLLKSFLFLMNPKYALDVKYKNRCVVYLENMTNLFLSMLHEYQMQKPIDIIHACDLDTLKAAVIFKKTHKNVKIIYDAHEFWPEQFSDLPEKYRHYLKNYEAALVPFIDAYFCVSDPMGDYVRDLYKINHVYVVPNATPNISIALSDVKSPLKELSKGRLSFLFQGGFGPERGLEELTHAWSKIDPNKAVLFLRGQSNEIYQKCMKIARADNTLDNSVYFLPSITEDRLIQEASEADIGVIPYKPSILNHVFACPNKLSQYMQAGLPLLASNCPYVAYHVNNAKAGIVYDAFDENALIESIHKLLFNPDQCRLFRKNAKEYASTNYHWDIFFKKIENLYA